MCRVFSLPTVTSRIGAALSQRQTSSFTPPFSRIARPLRASELLSPSVSLPTQRDECPERAERCSWLIDPIFSELRAPLYFCRRGARMTGRAPSQVLRTSPAAGLAIYWKPLFRGRLLLLTNTLSRGPCWRPETPCGKPGSGGRTPRRKRDSSPHRRMFRQAARGPDALLAL
uniref:Uncharacterized protein n=1 Tax=Sphaerodactylus townsendi TaxID=933632 RepID=A0ACB8F1L7_9SAUR